MSDRDALGRGAPIGILDCDCVGTGPEAAESTARTKGVAIDRVGVRRSPTRACDGYAAGGTAKASDVGLGTY